MWRGTPEPRIEGLVRAPVEQGVPAAAICAATSYLARLGLLDAGVRHTSNALAYLKDVAPDYAGEDLYVEAPAVSHAGIITAGAEAGREFAYEILKALGVYDDEVPAEFAEFWGVVSVRPLTSAPSRHHGAVTRLAYACG
jgi:putative intracellular protease/amidase